jgi:hypothetical protein
MLEENVELLKRNNEVLMAACNEKSEIISMHKAAADALAAENVSLYYDVL